MTEKRFVMRYGKYIDTVENIEYDEKWESWKIVELLNTLSEENEQLKKQLSDDFNQSNCITVQKSIISDLKKENEQLKADKQSLIDFIRKEFPKSHKHILEGFE